MSPRQAEIVSDANFELPSGRCGPRRLLLLNPPVYDAQYWARWSQPAGLLRIATLLKQRGCEVELIDCMETDAGGHVRRTARRGDDGRPMKVQRDDMVRPIYHFGLRWEEIQERMQSLREAPHEVWITSIMTYWWESTRDAVARVRSHFPEARIVVGGIYPTLAPEHAAERLGADVIFQGEIGAASNLPTDLTLYKTTPTYAILTTSRGCPWDCHYCAARTLNGGSQKVRSREPEDVLAEIEDKVRLGIRRYGFYEDNALIKHDHLKKILELIIERDMRLELYAPEGFETRMLTEDVLRTMKQAGFDKIHLPFEALRWETNEGWNRRHASTASFERALDAAIRAGFKPRTEDLNAFVLFGLPDEKLEDVVDGVLYVHRMVGSIVPMLFTPVPGTHIYRQHEQYLAEVRGWDLHDLNGKFLPFLEYNQQRYPGLRASDYLELERLMSILNSGKVLWRAADICGGNRTSAAFRSVVHAGL